MSASNSFQNALVRPLTAQEEIYWQLTYTDQIHGVRAAHVIGATTPEQWRSGLDALQMRHPSLSVSIESPSMDSPGLTQPFLCLHGNKKIPLRVVSHALAPRWEAEVEREHSIPFLSGEAPLARAVLIHGAESSVFILSASHSIQAMSEPATGRDSSNWLIEYMRYLRCLFDWRCMKYLSETTWRYSGGKLCPIIF
jgi:hypothetical protein